MQERIAFTNEILARPDIVPLREDADAPVSRYTTRAVLDGEQQILTAAERMNRDKSHGITARGRADMLDVHAQLDEEQRAAVPMPPRRAGSRLLPGRQAPAKAQRLRSATGMPARSTRAKARRSINLMFYIPIIGGARRATLRFPGTGTA